MKIQINHGRLGKSQMIEKMLSAYLKKNPNATICTFKNGEMIIEKSVKEIPMKMIEKK